MLITILEAFFIISIIVITTYLIRHYIFTFMVLRHTKKIKVINDQKRELFEPTVSILTPAHNEEKVIDRLLQQLSHLTYPKEKLQVIIIDDASSDTTGKIADNYAQCYNFIKVLHRNVEDGYRGKASALNAAFKNSTGEIILYFDADYIPQLGIVEKLVQEFTNPQVGSVQGRPIVLNEPNTLITRLVALERISGYRVDQEARDNLGLIPQFGGTIGGIRRNILEDLGGFDETMLTEDTDLTFSVYLKGYKIHYVGSAECYEEAVSTWRAYWRQRHRWARGHMMVCFKHIFSVLKSKRLSLKEKIDGVLLLNIYFMPILTLFSFLLGIPLILYGSQSASLLWFTIPIALYSFVGNFAPFFEVGIGAYLDGRKRIQWLLPFLIVAFLFNTLICTKALVDVLLSKIRRKPGDWAKTEHRG